MGYKGMKNILSRILMIGSLATLVACGGGGGDGGGDIPPSSSLSLITAFDTKVKSDAIALETGISTACYASNNQYIREGIFIKDSIWTYNKGTFSSDKCESYTNVSTTLASVVIDQDVTINGWIDEQGQATTTPSKASDPEINLSATVKYTRLNTTIIRDDSGRFTVGDTTNIGYVIDDSFSRGVKLYYVDENGFATNTNPFSNVDSNGIMSVNSVVYVDDFNTDIANRVLVSAMYDPADSFSDRSMITARYDYSSSPKQNQQFYDDVSITVHGVDIFSTSETTTVYNESNASLGVSSSILGVSYVQIPHAENTVVITSTGGVGQVTTGAYNFVICPRLAMPNGTCTTTTTTINGGFSIKRSPDVTP